MPEFSSGREFDGCRILLNLQLKFLMAESERMVESEEESVVKKDKRVKEDDGA